MPSRAFPSLQPNMLMKRALRKSVAEKLSQLTAQTIKTESIANANSLASLPEYMEAQNIAVYLHMDDGEARTDTIITKIFDDGKSLFLPKIVPLKNMEPQFPNQKTHLVMKHVKSQTEIDALTPQGRYRLREPEKGENCFARGGLDLIILPAVAYTKTCQRLGHGKGFYDSFIQEHIKVTGNKPKLVGVGLSPQLVESIPTESHDEHLDAVVVAGHLYK
ncbi:5-formyltetrahydrofolate cyclo-ligase [Wickerhamiella sorbophila]|uniref:5-formyltetrahydrofolate cyclo-ligase n=1 Tax=Wickerhamiella sorbophila TaxID=45607 RepID=A0A2T0FCH0_9ASCO|nr:5-formyltetrahydrofolate cyclo-ligase [Wickerhamiella sorbophila]PRT52704.1 5-formyltetrahydrofolate cyclo-ligase [Wickerhamiella sorbophila]